MATKPLTSNKIHQKFQSDREKLKQQFDKIVEKMEKYSQPLTQGQKVILWHIMKFPNGLSY